MSWSSPSERGRRFAEVERFQGLSPKDVKKVIKGGTSVRIGPGEVLLRQGEPGTGIFVVVSGELSVRQGEEDFGVLRAGDLIGEIGLVELVPATTTVTATSEVELLHIGYDETRRLIADVPRFREAIHATAHHRLERDRHRE
jgi:CRP/FNR family cyclic AMP-dependent transcriptional regulator